MSKGTFFQSAKYQATASNGGGIHPIKIQPETLTLNIGGSSNTSPAGAISNGIVANVGGSKRSNGLTTRKVTFAFVTAPSGYKQDSPISLPWLDDTTFDAISRGDTGTYSPEGTAENIVVISKSPEYPI